MNSVNWKKERRESWRYNARGNSAVCERALFRFLVCWDDLVKSSRILGLS